MMNQPQRDDPRLAAKQAAAQARYQEVAKKLHTTAKQRFPNRPISQIKFVQVDTPPNVRPGQLVNLTGAIEGRDLQIFIPAGARQGLQFEVPYIRYDGGSSVDHDDAIVVGDPFFVFPPVLSAREADEEASRQLFRQWQVQANAQQQQQQPQPQPQPDPAEWKVKGNAAFKAKDFREAARLYGAAVLACLHRVRTEAPLMAVRPPIDAATAGPADQDGGEVATTDREGEAGHGNTEALRRQAQLDKQKQLAVDLGMHIVYSNQALALMKLKPPRLAEALEACENALNIDPHYTKAFFRLGQCLEQVREVHVLVLRVGMLCVAAATAHKQHVASQFPHPL